MSEEEEKFVRELETVPISEIIIDGVVLLQIIKHCCEIPANSRVCGLLTGISLGDRIIVTNNIPLVGDEGLKFPPENVKKCLQNIKNANYEHLQVGFYSAIKQSNIVGELMLKALADFEVDYKKHFFFVFDPAYFSMGFLYLKAFAFTDAFRKNLKEIPNPVECVSKMKYVDLFFEEKPIKIENFSLVSACMLQQRLISSSSSESVRIEDYDEEDALFDCLCLSNSSTVVSSLDAISHYEEDVGQEVLRYNQYTRSLSKKGKDSQQPYLYPTSCFRSVLLLNQIHHQGRDLESFIAQTAAKLYLLNQVDKGTHSQKSRTSKRVSHDHYPSPNILSSDPDQSKINKILEEGEIDVEELDRVNDEIGEDDGEDNDGELDGVDEIEGDDINPNNPEEFLGDEILPNSSF